MVIASDFWLQNALLLLEASRTGKARGKTGKAPRWFDNLTNMIIRAPPPSGQSQNTSGSPERMKKPAVWFLHLLSIAASTFAVTDLLF